MGHALPRLSSCVILTALRAKPDHEPPDGHEFFWAKRQEALKFLGGFYAFLGGAIEAMDAQLGGADAVQDSALDQLIGCAARELFEEAGLLFVQGQGMLCADEEPLASVRAIAQRGQPEALYAYMQREGLSLDRARYKPIGRWVTPSWSPLRFETEFFQVQLNEQERERASALPQWVQSQELERGEWMSAQEALGLALKLKRFVSAPTMAFIHHIAQSERSALTVLDQEDLDDVLQHHWIAADTYMVAMKSPTLAPATHTNSYIVAGQERFIVIDPGSAKPKELEALFTVIDALIAQGLKFEAIALTHHHIDHVCGVPSVRARYPEAAVWAHELTAQALIEGAPFEFLSDGQRLDLGQREIKCVWTPGHAPGHLAFWDARLRLCISGDLIASQGTILIRPPEGKMHEYMTSLAYVRDELKPVALCPAHGWMIVNPALALTHYIEHRQQREDKVLQALRDRPGLNAPGDLLSQVYGDVPRSVWPIALMSLSAHLEHLCWLGLATMQGGAYQAA